MRGFTNFRNKFFPFGFPMGNGTFPGAERFQRNFEAHLNDFERNFGEHFWNNFGGDFDSRHEMAINIYENDKEYLVLAKTGELKKEQISISFQGPYLDIKVQDKEKKDTENKEEVSGRPRKDGLQGRRIHLENAINVDSVKAKMEDGVLRITIQKEDVKPVKPITIS